MRIQSLWKKLIKFNFKEGLVVKINCKFREKLRRKRCTKILGFKRNIINNYLLQNFKKVLINYKYSSIILKRSNKNNL